MIYIKLAIIESYGDVPGIQDLIMQLMEEKNVDEQLQDIKAIDELLHDLHTPKQGEGDA